LPIYQRGILYGNSTIREVSAAGLGEIVSLTSSKYLAGPLIIKITGPLLRIVGDRNPSNVKIAILRTLGLILVKGGPALRAFVPQFQTTFVKALSDPSRQVRVEAIQALALLMPLATRVDPLLKELVSGSLGKSVGATGETAATAVQTASLEGLAVVLEKGGSKAKTPDSIPAALNAAKELLNHDDDGVREAAAKVMGSACELVGVEVTTATIRNDVLGRSDASVEVKHGKACACHRILASSIGTKLDESLMSDLLKLVVSYMHDDKDIVKEAACVAIGALVGSSSDAAGRLRSVESEIMEILCNKKETIDVHRAMARGLCLMMHLSTIKDRVNFLGKAVLDECLQLAMSGSQRVQYAYNDVLWMALKVDEGEQGLETYMEIANFDNTKAMKSLYSKVLTRIKQVDLD
jgi:HEAT repeat protein